MNRYFHTLAALAVITFLMGCTMDRKKAISLDGDWMFCADSTNRGRTERWFDTGTDRRSWERQRLPGYWDRYNDYAKYDGAGWYARVFEMADTSKPLSVFFGGVDDDADVWVNGIHTGSHAGYSDAFALDISKAVRPGKNEIVIRVMDYSGPGGIYKPVSIVPTAEVEELFRTKFADLHARESADWVKDAVIYEVYLRSFSKEGSFKALEARLPELRELGVTVVWLMPIHPVGELNRKGTLGSPYSIRDYYEINPEFGTLEDFQSLVNSVHAAGMKIIIDLVANHTAWDARILLDHPEWYTHNGDGAIVAPNPDWTDVADLNYDSHELRKYMIRMMRHWVEDIGIDGYRCDVAEMVPTDFWETSRGELDKIRPVMMLAEGTLPEHHVKAFDITYAWNVYDVLGKVIDGTTSASVFDQLLGTESRQFPQQALRLRFNTNHDKNAWDAPAVEKFTPDGAKATAVLTFTLPGIPLIYNGEEAGNPTRLSLFDKTDIDWSKGRDFRGHYSHLAALRAEHPALRRGSYRMIDNPDGEKVFAFIRAVPGDSVLTVINFGKAPAMAKILLPGGASARVKAVYGSAGIHQDAAMLQVDLPALGYSIMTIR